VTELSENAQKIAEARYFMEGENWEKLCNRVGNAIAVNENDKDKWAEVFANEIFDMNFIPGGRILRNAGRLKGELANCFVIPIGDSIEEIGDYIKNSLICWSGGGGVGCNFSPLRPKGFPIRGKGGESTGLVSFLKASDSVASTIQSGGSRRAAGLVCVSVEHPEVENFINAKLVDKIISHYNISVAITNEFLEAVEEDELWTFKFLAQETHSKPARKLWNLILSNMIKCGEPGLLNFTNLTKNNGYYFAPPISSNPCGEAILAPWESCILGSLVLPNFLSGTQTNWKKLENSIEIIVRFLDNVIDVNNFSVQKIELNSKKGRKIGVGVIGFADFLFKKGIRYGSEKSIAEAERLARFIRDKVYESSIRLSREKGPFPAFDSHAYGKASFVRKLPATLRRDIKRYGTRNVTVQAIAPTGTISLLVTPEVCPSIEPLFSKAYIRRDRVSERIYIHPLVRECIEQNKKLPDWLVDTSDLSPKDHLEIQTAFQKFTDGGVSKTINFPKGTTKIQLSDWLLEYAYDLKGVTVYVDGSREGQVLQKLSLSEAKKLLSKSTSSLSEDDVSCARGSCEI